MKKYLLLVLLFFAPLAAVIAQVHTNPAMVLQDKSVEIFYDATKGTSGLKGASKVYMHAGVVIDGPTSNRWQHVIGNWGQDNGVGLMEKVEGHADLWKITLESPRKYFKVPEDKTIYRIGMVFRNAAGDREGKSDQNQDIFVQVYDGYSVTFQQPATTQLFFNENEVVEYRGVSTGESHLSVYFNDVLLQELSNSKAISGNFTPDKGGVLKITGKLGDQESEDKVDLIKRVQSVSKPLPQNIKKGININKDNNTVTLALHAPHKNSVYAVGDFSDWEIHEDNLLNRDGDIFWITLSNLDPDFEYAFYYLIDEQIKVADPYSYKVLDAAHDNEIRNQNKYPGLRVFPTQAGTQRLSVFKINKEEYEWQVKDFKKPAKEDLVIYELLVRDFSDERSYQAVIDKIGYLKELGINALELMPINQFEGNLSWGYNPAFFFAVDKFYGPENDLKRLVDECHKNGIAVILDMVFNHSFSQSPLLQMYMDRTANRAAADNPWYLQEHIFENDAMRFGYPFNHGSPYFRAFMDSANHYWIKEFKIDGFRFDLTKGFTTQKKGGNDPWGSRYDQERVDNLERMAKKIWEVNEEAYVILEHLADNDEERALANKGMMLWGNLNHSYADAAMGYFDSGKSNFSWISHKRRNWNDSHVVGYMESHDEERMMFRLHNWGNSSGRYNTKETSTALNRAKMATAFFIPIPGPKMIWQFGELGYDISIDFNGRVGVKPTKWEYYDDPERRKLFEVYASLNKIKTKYKVFRTSDYTLNVAGEYKTILLRGEDMNVNVIGNFGLTARNVNITFPNNGYWWDYFSGDSIAVQGSTYTMRLEPGQFHVFLSEKVVHEGANPTPFSIYDMVTSISNIGIIDMVNVYPNPASGVVNVNFLHEGHAFQNPSIKLINTQGKIVKSQLFQSGSQTDFSMEVSDLGPGLYFLEISSGRERLIRKVIIK